MRVKDTVGWLVVRAASVDSLFVESGGERLNVSTYKHKVVL